MAGSAEKLQLDSVALQAAFDAADAASPTGRAYAPGIEAAVKAYLASSKKTQPDRHAGMLAIKRLCETLTGASNTQVDAAISDVEKQRGS